MRNNTSSHARRAVKYFCVIRLFSLLSAAIRLFCLFLNNLYSNRPSQSPQRLFPEKNSSFGKMEQQIFFQFWKSDEKFPDFPKRIPIKSDFTERFPPFLDFPTLKSLIIAGKNFPARSSPAFW